MSNDVRRGTSRSGFLKQAAGATIAVAGAGVGVGALASEAAAASGRSYTAGKFLLTLDGENCGFMAGLDGGDPDFDLLYDLPIGSDNIQRKSIGAVKYEDFTLQVGSNMGKPMYDWIKNSFDRGYVTKNGSFQAADFNYKEVRHQTMSQAYITSVTIPALDAASTTPVYMPVTVHAAAINTYPATGNLMGGNRQKAWLPGNFVFEIDGVDTSRVAKIDSFTWKCTVAPDGSQVLDVSNLGVSFPRASLPSWRRWYDNQGGGGGGGGGGVSDERNGLLSMVGANGGGVATIGLFNLGLFRLIPDPARPAARIRAELYCESMSYDLVLSKKV